MWTWARHWRIALSVAIGSVWILLAFLLLNPLEAHLSSAWIVASAFFALFLVYGLLAPDRHAAPLFLMFIVVATAAANARWGLDVCGDSATCTAVADGASRLLLVGALLLVLPTLLGSHVSAKLRRDRFPLDEDQRASA